MSLSQVNEQYRYPSSSISTGDAGAFGGLVRWLRRKIFGTYLVREEEYLGHLVRCLNTLSAEVARLRAERDDELQGAMYAVERTVMSRVDENRGAMTAAAGEQGERLRTIGERVERVESVMRGLEQLALSLSPDSRAPASSSTPPASAATGLALKAAATDASYLIFENRYRGDERTIAARIAPYGDLFAESPGPVLELGPGRGELLDLFRNRGIAAYGVEIDAAMVERCRSRGLDVRNEDVLAHLASLPDGSLGGFIAVQVVEHLSSDFLVRLMKALARALHPGARLALETINTLSIVSAAHNYTRDVTHVAPRHPDTIEFLVETSGFTLEERRLLSPFPAGAMLQEIPAEPWFPERFAATVDAMNRNVHQLNQLLYGAQDYCVIARRA